MWILQTLRLLHLAKIYPRDKNDHKNADQFVLNRCETWYQWMVARLLFTNPSVRAYDLNIHAQQAVDRYGTERYLRYGTVGMVQYGTVQETT